MNRGRKISLVRPPSHSARALALALPLSLLALPAPAEPPSALGNPYLFQGARYDVETGFYYLRNRYYDAGTGRFLQRDPVWDPMSSGNAYPFVGNSPLSRRDPRGTLGDPVEQARDMIERDVVRYRVRGAPSESAYEAASRAADREFNITVAEAGKAAQGSFGAKLYGAYRLYNAPFQYVGDKAVAQVTGVIESLAEWWYSDGEPSELSEGQVALNCEQFVQEAMRSAGLEEKPVPIAHLTARWQEEKDRPIDSGSRDWLIAEVLSESGYLGPFGGHFQVAPEDYRPSRGDIIVYFLEDQPKHIAMFTGSGLETVENTSSSNAAVNPNAFDVSAYSFHQIYRYVGPSCETGETSTQVEGSTKQD